LNAKKEKEIICGQASRHRSLEIAILEMFQQVLRVCCALFEGGYDALKAVAIEEHVGVRSPIFPEQMCGNENAAPPRCRQ